VIENWQSVARAELKQKANELWAEFDSSGAYPADLFHYTSVAGFESILSSRELWCTNVRDVVGDRNEGNQAMRIIRSAVVTNPCQMRSNGKSCGKAGYSV